MSSDKEKDWSRRIFEKKAKVYSRLSEFHPVAISPWLQTEANKSGLFPEENVGMIWNGIDLNNFTTISPAKAKEQLGLPLDKKILLLGASYADSKLKGYDQLLNEFDKVKDFAKEFCVVRFGRASSEGRRAFAIKDFGYISDRKKLNTIYAASDLYLSPSPQEAFGKTIVEALASGTPVIVFDNSGPKDMIENDLTGRIVESDDFSAYAREAILWARTRQKSEKLQRDCTLSAQKFSARNAAQEYMKLYQKILEK